MGLAGGGDITGSKARALYALARPRLLPYVALLPLAGFGWAHWDRALTPHGAAALGPVMAAWALLHAGTLWLNAAVDRDEGEVLMGEAVPVPDGAAAWGYGALAGCVLLAVGAHPISGLAAVICAALSIAYSHPATLWKGHPLLGPMVNVVGYGLLSPLAGWAVVDVAPNPRTLAVWALGGLGILGAYFAAQAFQRDEDAARGYRTLVVTHGPRAAVGAGRACIGAGFLLAVVLAVVGWFPRICLVAAPLWLWVDQWFAAWMREPDGGSEAWARGMAKRMFWSGIVLLVLLLGAYTDQVRRDVPVAGLATAAGLPADRPLLSPGAMRRWEHARALDRQRAARAASTAPSGVPDRP